MSVWDTFISCKLIFFPTPTGPDVLNWLREKRLQHRTVTGWYCRYHRNVQSMIQVVHWVIWESIDTHQWYPYLHDVTTTSQQSSDCIVHPCQQKRCTYLLYTCLFFPHGQNLLVSCCFSFKKNKKTTWKAEKVGKKFSKHPAVVRRLEFHWSCWWSVLTKKSTELREIKKGVSE